MTRNGLKLDTASPPTDFGFNRVRASVRKSAPIASPESARTFWSISAVVAVCSCADSVDRRLSFEVLLALRSVCLNMARANECYTFLMCPIPT